MTDIPDDVVERALGVEAMPPFAGSRTMRLMEEATIRDAAAAIRSRKD